MNVTQNLLIMFVKGTVFYAKYFYVKNTFSYRRIMKVLYFIGTFKSQILIICGYPKVLYFQAVNHNFEFYVEVMRTCAQYIVLSISFFFLGYFLVL